MFSNISWREYWFFLAVIVFLYYVLIYLIYFKASVRIMFQRGKSKNSLESAASSQKESEQSYLFGWQESSHQTSTDENEVHIVEACMDELNAFFENHKKSKAVKSELLYALYTVLQKYPSLQNSNYRKSIANVIATQCENICSIHLSAEELKGVWFG